MKPQTFILSGKYKLGTFLGNGSFGKVYSGTVLW